MHCWEDAGQEWEGNLAFAVFLKCRTVLPIHEIKIVAKEWENALKVVRPRAVGAWKTGSSTSPGVALIQSSLHL